MRIQIPTIDDLSRTAGYDEAVIDLEMDRPVGFLHTDQPAPGDARKLPRASISLFGGKYTGSFDTHEECVAFAMGVQAVINHLMSNAEARAPDAN